MRLLDDRIAVEIEAEVEEKSPGGIVVPDAARNKNLAVGKIVVAGPGKRLDTPFLLADKMRAPSGTERRPMEVKVGDRVVFYAHAGFKVKDGKREVTVLGEADIIAIL